MTTWVREARNSPDALRASMSGKKARMVVRELTSRGRARDAAESSAARRRSAPAASLRWMSSATTMPLSTRSPRATMMAAMEMRWMAMPHRDMPTSTAMMVRGTPVPTMSPVRQPRKTMTTKRTTATVCQRFSTAPATASATSCGW